MFTMNVDNCLSLMILQCMKGKYAMKGRLLLRFRFYVQYQTTLPDQSYGIQNFLALFFQMLYHIQSATTE